MRRAVRSSCRSVAETGLGSMEVQTAGPPWSVGIWRWNSAEVSRAARGPCLGLKQPEQLLVLRRPSSDLPKVAPSALPCTRKT